MFLDTWNREVTLKLGIDKDLQRFCLFLTQQHPTHPAGSTYPATYLRVSSTPSVTKPLTSASPVGHHFLFHSVIDLPSPLLSVSFHSNVNSTRAGQGFPLNILL